MHMWYQSNHDSKVILFNIGSMPNNISVDGLTIEQPPGLPGFGCWAEVSEKGGWHREAFIFKGQSQG